MLGAECFVETFDNPCRNGYSVSVNLYNTKDVVTTITKKCLTWLNSEIRSCDDGNSPDQWSDNNMQLVDLRTLGRRDRRNRP